MKTYVAGARPVAFEAEHPSYRKSDIVGRMARDPAKVAAHLAGIVARELAHGAPVEIADLRTPVGAGASNETFLFEARWRDARGAQTRGLVLRICPQDFQLFMDPRLADQVKLLKVLHAGGRVKVAEPIFYEPGTEPFGQSYFIMSRLEGRVPVSFPPYNSGGFLFDASVAERRRLWESAVDSARRGRPHADGGRRLPRRDGRRRRLRPGPEVVVRLCALGTRSRTCRRLPAWRNGWSPTSPRRRHRACRGATRALAT